MDITYHYPPELFELLVEAIPRLFKGKQGVIDFLRGAGVSEITIRDLQLRVDYDRDNISKAEIVRTVLQRLNAKGELTLGERREI